MFFPVVFQSLLEFGRDFGWGFKIGFSRVVLVGFCWFFRLVYGFKSSVSMVSRGFL